MKAYAFNMKAEPKRKVNHTLRLDPELHEKLKQHCAKKGIPVETYLRRMVEARFKAA